MKGKQVVCLILASPLLFMILVSIVMHTLGSGILREREEGLLREFHAIQQPVYANQLYFNKGRKNLKRWLGMTYDYKYMDAKQVEAYFDKELARNGWQKRHVGEEEFKTFRHFRYTKGEYELFISPYPYTKRDYELGVPPYTKPYWLVQMKLNDWYDHFG